MAISSYNTQMNKKFYVGAHSALELAGFNHYVPMGKPVLMIGHPKQDKVPDWMMKTDSEFRQLFQRHRELDKQVLDAELGVLPLDDSTLSRMKREKLYAKDRLIRMYETKHA